MAKISTAIIENYSQYERHEIAETVLSLTPGAVPAIVEGQKITPISVSVSGEGERNFVEYHPLGELYPPDSNNPNGSYKYVRVLWEASCAAGLSTNQYASGYAPDPGPYPYYADTYYEFFNESPSQYPQFQFTGPQIRAVFPQQNNDEHVRWTLNANGESVTFDLTQGIYGQNGASTSAAIPVEEIEMPYDRAGNANSVSETLKRVVRVRGRVVPELGSGSTEDPTFWWHLTYELPQGKNYIKWEWKLGNSLVTYDTGTWDPASNSEGNPIYEVVGQTTQNLSTNNGERTRRMNFELNSGITYTVKGPKVIVNDVQSVLPLDPSEVFEDLGLNRLTTIQHINNSVLANTSLNRHYFSDRGCVVLEGYFLLDDVYLGEDIGAQASSTLNAIQECELQAMCLNWAENQNFGRFGYCFPTPPESFGDPKKLSAELAFYRLSGAPDYGVDGYYTNRDPWDLGIPFTLLERPAGVGAQKDFGIQHSELQAPIVGGAADLRWAQITARQEWTRFNILANRNAQLYNWWDDNFLFKRFLPVDDLDFSSVPAGAMHGFAPHYNCQQNSPRGRLRFDYGKQVGGPGGGNPLGPDRTPNSLRRVGLPAIKRSDGEENHISFNFITGLSLLTGKRILRELVDYKAQMAILYASFPTSEDVIDILCFNQNNYNRSWVYHMYLNTDRGQQRAMYAAAQCYTCMENREVANRLPEYFDKKYYALFRDPEVGIMKYRRSFGTMNFDSQREMIYMLKGDTIPNGPGGSVRNPTVNNIGDADGLHFFYISSIPQNNFRQNYNRVRVIGTWMYGMGLAFMEGFRLCLENAASFNTDYGQVSEDFKQDMKDMVKSFVSHAVWQPKKSLIDPLQVCTNTGWNNRGETFYGIPYYMGQYSPDASALIGDPDEGFLAALSESEKTSGAKPDNPYAPPGSGRKFIHFGNYDNLCNFDPGYWDKNKGAIMWGANVFPLAWKFAKEDNDIPYQELVKARYDDWIPQGGAYVMDGDPDGAAYSNSKSGAFNILNSFFGLGINVPGRPTAVGRGVLGNDHGFQIIYVVDDPFETRVIGNQGGSEFSIQGTVSSFGSLEQSASVEKTIETDFNSLVSFNTSAIFEVAMFPIASIGQGEGSTPSLDVEDVGFETFAINGVIRSTASIDSSSLYERNLINQEFSSVSELESEDTLKEFILSDTIESEAEVSLELSREVIWRSATTSSVAEVTLSGQNSFRAIQGNLNGESILSATPQYNRVIGGTFSSVADLSGALIEPNIRGETSGLATLTGELVKVQYTSGTFISSGSITSEIDLDQFKDIRGDIISVASFDASTLLRKFLIDEFDSVTDLDASTSIERVINDATTFSEGRIYATQIFTPTLDGEIVSETSFDSELILNSDPRLDPPPEGDGGGFGELTVIARELGRQQFDELVNQTRGKQRHRIYTDYLKDLYQLSNPDSEISEIYRDTLRQIQHVFSDIHYRNDQNEVIPIKCNHARPERVIAAITNKTENIILPQITVDLYSTDADEGRRRSSSLILQEKWWDPEKQRAVRVISLAPVPVNLTYRVYVWSKYMANIDQITEQINGTFNPSIEIITPDNNTTKAFLVNQADDSDTNVSDGSDRVLRRSFDISVETYIPRPKFKITNTGAIERINSEILVRTK